MTLYIATVSVATAGMWLVMKRKQGVATRLTEWADRALAACAGAAGTVAVVCWLDRQWAPAAVATGLATFVLWASAPAHPRRGARVPQPVRDELMERLRAAYGVPDTGILPDTAKAWRLGVSGDPFGTRIVWCRADIEHDAHLWPVNGEGYAPALCMGHQCATPERHFS